MMSSQLFCLLIAIVILSLIDVSKAHTKRRLCQLLCCGENEQLDQLTIACDTSCNECKVNHSVGGVCEPRIHKDQLRGCSKNFTCAVTCRNECDSVGREDDESDEDYPDLGSGDDLKLVTSAVHAPAPQPTGDSENQLIDSESPPLTYDSSWGLTNLHVILIIVAVCLCFLIVCMLLFFAVRFMMNERKMSPPLNRGQYPPAVFYTGKMATISQGSMFNQPSPDFSNVWC